MKTKRIAKIIGLGLSVALALSLGAGIGLTPASADVHEWSTINTPSWEDHVIEPGSDIYDYAVSPDGEMIVAVGGADVGFVDHDGGGGDPFRPSNLHGAFFIDGSDSVAITTISSDTAEISGTWEGEACFLFGNFTMCGAFEDPNNASYQILFSLSGEITGNPFDGLDNDTMEFSGMLYSDGDSDLSALASSYTVNGDLCVDGAEFIGDLGDLTAWEALYTQPRVWQSDDGGVTWTNITADVQDATNLPGPFLNFGYGGVDIAPDDGDWFAIAGGACDVRAMWAEYQAAPINGWYQGNFPWMPIAGFPAAVATQDGGSNFSYAGDMHDSSNGTWMFQMYDIAVSPEVDDIHNIAIGGINDETGIPVNGSGTVYRLEAGTWLTGSWVDTSYYDGWDDHVNVPGATHDLNTSGVVDVEFSPNMDLDDTIVVIGLGNPDTGDVPSDEPTNNMMGLPYIQQGTWGSDNSWNNEAAFSDAILIDSEGEALWSGVYLRSMGLALPADYDGTDSGARAIYCYVNAWNEVTGLVGGFLFRVDDGSVSEPYGPSGEPLLASVDFHGDADTGKMIVGEYVGWDNAGGWDGIEVPPEGWGEIQPDPCEGVRVWHTVELDPCCPDWELACKNPSGPFTALVMYTPDGDKAYATTSGLMDLDMFNPWDTGIGAGWTDESAFSVSLDDGVSFNQLGLIDTDIDYLSDLAVCPDCSVIYLSSVNETQTLYCCDSHMIAKWGQCDSVWRSYDNGDTWERIFHGEWSNSLGTRLELRLPCEDTEDCCTLYLGIQHSDEMYYSRDCGQCWTQTPGTKIDIYDFAVEAENTVYVLDADGYVSMSTQFGRRWSDEVDTEVGSGHTITACCIGDLVVVGGNGDEPVAWSDDGGETWTTSDDLDGSSNQTVHVTCDPVCEGIIYAATDGAGGTHGTIYRVDISDGSVTDLEPMPYDYTGIVMSRQGVLYAASDEISVYYDSDYCCGREIVDTSYADEYYSGVVRNLDPCDTACCGSEDWDYLYTGTDPFSGWPWEADTDFDAQPSSLRICGCLSMDTNSVLYAIDRNATFGEYYYVVDGSDGTVWTYEDCTAKKAPEIISPVCGEDIPSEPCEGCTNVDINLCWTNICDACYYDIEIATDEDFTQTIGLYSSYWDEHVDLDCYEPADCADPCLLIPNGALQAGTTYYWHVRVSGVETGECVKSQWSETCSFNVMAGAGAGVSLLAPENGSVGIGNESVGFSWTSVGGATSYSFVLSPNSDLSGALASEELSSTAYTYTGMLDYSTPYFWQVTAWKDGSELSTSDVGAFTTADEPPPPPPAPEPATPPPDIVIPPAEQITPGWIIACIAIGAALIVLVIVLVVKTRRP